MLRECQRVPTTSFTLLRLAAREMAPVKLLDQVGEAARLRHLSPRTEKAYVFWIRRFVIFHGKRHPREQSA